MATIQAALADRLRTTSATAYVSRVVMELTDGLVVNGAADPYWRLNLAIREALRVSVMASAGGHFTAVLRAALRARDTLRAGVGVSLRDRLKLRSKLTAIERVVLREALKVVVHQTVTAVYRKTLTSKLAVSGRFGHGVGALLHDVLVAAPSLRATYRAVSGMADELELTDVLTPKLILIVVASEELVVTGVETLQAIYNSTLREGLDFILDTVDLAGDITTWAMNVRTGAVTEYLNYGFTSLARAPGGGYLGADDTGLYELTGRDDAGAPIPTDMISGLVDFSGQYLTSIRAAYLGIRGGGEMFLKLTEATGRSFTYRVKTQSLRTARVDIGKGLRARFFTFELMTTGQEFDLESIAFLPVSSTRRI